MYKIIIDFEDFDGNARQEEHYFNLSKSEIIAWEVESNEPLTTTLMDMVEKKDKNAIMRSMIDILRRSYGRKSEDGRSFRKSDEIWEDFYQTGAWDACFMKLLTDPSSIIDFVVGILPADLQEKMKSSDELKALKGGSFPPSKAGPKKPQDMTREELLAAMQAKMAAAQS